MNLPEPNDDERLSALFRADSFSVMPAGLDGRIRRRIRSHRRRRVVLGGACAAAVLLGLVLWQWPRPNGVSENNPAVALGAPERLPEVRELFAGPPVATLDVLARQHDAYLALLEQLQKE
jgi:hypothetical protein